MIRRATRSVVIAVGVASTVGIATFGLSLLKERLRRASPTISNVAVATPYASGEAPSVGDDGPRPRTRISVGPTGLQYFEDENVLLLYLEMTSRYDIVYVPTARRWPARMPEWARQRRDDIMAEIKRLAVGRPIRWVDDDT